MTNDKIVKISKLLSYINIMVLVMLDKRGENCTTQTRLGRHTWGEHSLAIIDIFN